MVILSGKSVHWYASWFCIKGPKYIFFVFPFYELSYRMHSNLRISSCDQSFKEMVAMCLVKDQTKRPTADKLLKHSFFKNSKPPELSVKKLFDELPPLWNRVKALQVAVILCDMISNLTCVFVFNLWFCENLAA